jgi:parallel beta-helix repeat protein
MQYRSHFQHLEDNYLHHNAYGIGVVNGGADNVNIRRNLIEHNQKDGISLVSGKPVVVEGNIISNNRGHSIYAYPSVTAYTIVGNDLRNNGAAASLGSTDGLFDDNRERRRPA